MTGVRKSLLLSLLGSYLGLVLYLVATFILSRILTPHDIGVFAIAVVFSTLASTFRDFGVAEYLIQERELTTEKIRAAFALNIIVSWLMAALLFGGSFAAARFYREPGVGDVIRVLSMSFIIVPFGAVTNAWFRRQLDYRPIVICNLLSSVASFVVAITLAYKGFGPMSLAWSTFAGIAMVVTATMWFRPREFPLLPSFKGIGHAINFGKFASLIYIFGQLGKGAPELIIGRASGAADVGIFSRGNGLVEVFNRIVIKPVMAVAMPYFAQQDRETGGIEGAYRASAAMITAVGWPFMAVMMVLAFPAIRIVYGDQWLAAVPLAQILCLACAIELLFLTSREALLACGRAKQAGTLQMQIVAAQIAGLMLVFPFGLPGAASGLVAAAVAGAALSQRQVALIGVGSRALIAACGPSALMALVCAAPLALLAQFVPMTESNYPHWAVGGASYATLAWLAALRVLSHPLWNEIMKIVRRLRPAVASTG